MSDQASPEQVRAVRRSRQARKARLEADLKAMEKTRRRGGEDPPRPATTTTVEKASSRSDHIGDVR